LLQLSKYVSRGKTILLWQNPEYRKKQLEKISKYWGSNKGKHWGMSLEARKRLMGRVSNFKGKKLSEESKIIKNKKACF
jgi:hypothetical protein